MTPSTWQNHRVAKFLGLSFRSVSTWEQTILNSDVMMLRRRSWFSSGFVRRNSHVRRILVVFHPHDNDGDLFGNSHESLFERNEENQHHLQPRLTMTSQIALVGICFVSGRQFGWFYRIQLWGPISPVYGVRLSSGKKHCVSKDEDYKKHESPNWANLTFNQICMD